MVKLVVPSTWADDEFKGKESDRWKIDGSKWTMYMITLINYQCSFHMHGTGTEINLEDLSVRKKEKEDPSTLKACLTWPAQKRKEKVIGEFHDYYY